MMLISPSQVLAVFRAGQTYALHVPYETQYGVLEDLCDYLRAANVEVAGYDVFGDGGACRVELRAHGNCMVDAELIHSDLRLMTVGEFMDPGWDALDVEHHPVQIQVWSRQDDLRRMAALRAFEWVEAFVPKRFANEEFGDSLEEISSAIQQGRSGWWVRFKIVSTVFWVLLHAVLEARFGRR